ncbi:MAG TPA: PorT family protein [Cytophagales bacterium]|nr:PorT family protein [Cytophagales bacterium]
MPFVNFWNSKYLHSAKTFIACLLALFFLTNQMAHAQLEERKPVINLPNYDVKKLHFGFYLALNYATYRVKRSDFMAQHPDSIRSVSPIGSPGFTLGFIFNLKLADYVDLRLVPGVAFYERTLAYEFGKKGDYINQISENTMAEFPLLFKLKSERRANTRMYFLVGGKYSIASGLRKKDKKPDELRTINNDLSIEYGFGFDIYYEYFKFSPEIRFSHGLFQSYANDPNPYANALKQLNTHTVTISFHFQ